MSFEDQNTEAEQKPRRRGSAVLVVIAVFSILTFFVYQVPFGGSVVSRVVSVLPYPIAKVNGVWVLYRDALQRRNGLEEYYSHESLELSDKIDFEQKLIQSLVHERLIRQLMKEHKIFLDDDAVTLLMGDLETQAGSHEKLESDISEVYGWSLKKFEKHVAKPFVEAQALENAFFQDREIQQPKRDLIEQASSRITDGEKFDAMVLDYSEDGTKVYNGDFGWFSENELPASWFGPATHMSEGDISPVLEERDRFTILRLDAVDKSREQARYNVSAIVVNKLSLTEIIEDYSENSDIKIFVRIE